MNSHKANIHILNKFKCTECTETFATEQKMRRHTSNVHIMNNYKCTECTETFATEQKMKRHTSNVHIMNNFKCTECIETFVTKQNMNLEQAIERAHHELNELEKQFECVKNKPEKFLYDIIKIT